MKHSTNARLAALLREFADRIENDETELTECCARVDLSETQNVPIERNVDPRAPTLFAPKPAAKLVH